MQFPHSQIFRCELLSFVTAVDKNAKHVAISSHFWARCLVPKHQLPYILRFSSLSRLILILFVWIDKYYRGTYYLSYA